MMSKPTRYAPKRLARPSALPPSYGRAGDRQYSLYILPSGASSLAPEDVERFPPVPLGDEKAARTWLDRAMDGGGKLPAVTPEGKRRKRRQFFRDLLFYAALAAFVLGVFLLSGSRDGAPTTFLGFSAMRVLTGSMESEIPKGSLIITCQVDPNTLEIGDDITYFSGANTTVTHRIVAITEHDAATGQRAFTTQGLMNEDPDRLLVPAANVVGKVVFHSLVLGEFLYFVRQYWKYLLVLALLLAGLYKSLQVVFEEIGKEREEPSGTAWARDRRGAL